MRNLKALLMGSAAFVSIGVATEAQAQSTAYGAGATFPAIAYRQMMDCLYGEALGSPGKPTGTGIVPPGCTLGFNSSGFGGKILYVPTGSGNGKLVHRTNRKQSITAPSVNIPYTSTDIGVTEIVHYDGVQFAGSDDVFTSGDLNLWNTQNQALDGEGNPLNQTAQQAFGNPIQIPSLLGAVAVGFNGTDGAGAALNIFHPTPANGSSGLRLSRNALCGIVSGHITKWNNPILTALNGGVALGGNNNITFIHRSDGSGTSFLFVNALATQCQFEVGPNNETGGAPTVSYAFPWTERTATCPAGSFFVARPANLSNWPDFTTDQCGVTIPNPGGGTFNRASGSGGVVDLVTATNGSMGYASADFWLPVRVGGKATANLQSQWDLSAGTGQFQPPSWQAAQIAMSAAVPQMDNTTRANPLTWSLQAVEPNPTLPGSYPITGFTFMLTYQCFKTHSNGNNAQLWFKTFLDYIYGTTAQAQLNANGFATVPPSWQNEIYTLILDPTNGFNGSGCAGKVGAY
jgi:phosphate transport system substrate-binding protein